MRTHLEGVHGIKVALHKTIVEAAAKEGKVRGKSITHWLPTIASSSSLSSSSSSTSATTQQKRKWTLMLLRMAVEMNISFRSLCECEVLRVFLLEELGWVMPSRWTLTRLLPSFHSYVVNALRIRLQSVDSLCITTDSTFLTRHQVPYIGITGHWIDSNWKLQRTVLAVFLAEQSETADFISTKLRDVLNTQLGFGRQIHCITTDEGQNFLNAAQSLKNSETVRESLRCVCHRLQLVVKKAYLAEECTELRLLLDKCSDIVNQFKNGWQSGKRDVLRRHQVQYIETLKAELTQQRTELAHSTRAVQDQLKEKDNMLDRANKLLAEELSESKESDGSRAAARDEINELDMDENAERHAVFEDDSDDESSEDEKEDPVIVDAVLTGTFPTTTEDAKRGKAFIDYIFKKRALIQRAVTRWLTYVNVVERCVIWRKPLMSALNEIQSSRIQSRRAKQKGSDWTQLHISDSEETILQHFYIVAKACKQVLTSLEGDHHTTVGSLLWHQHRLVKFLKGCAANSGISEPIRSFCAKAVETSAVKFTSGVDNAAMIGAALDPRHKQMTYLSGTDAGRCKDALKAAYISLLIEQGEEPESDQDTGQLKKKHKINKPDIFTDFTGNILDTFSPSKKQARQSEFDRYVDHPEQPRDIDPLDWWRLHAPTTYPKLAILAQRYLAIPASSASSERLFSRLKLTATAARQGLSSETLCMLLFVSHHQGELKL